MDSRESVLEKLVVKTEQDSDFKVIVHEDDARTAHLVLPASAELNDAQLEHAAGELGATSQFGSSNKSESSLTRTCGLTRSKSRD